MNLSHENVLNIFSPDKVVVCDSAVFCEFWPATRSVDGSDNNAQQSSGAAAQVTSGSVSELETLVCHPNDTNFEM